MTPICKTHFSPSLDTKHMCLWTAYLYIYTLYNILSSRLIFRGSVFLTHLKMYVGVTTKKMCLQDVSTRVCVYSTRMCLQFLRKFCRLMLGSFLGANQKVV